MVSHPLTYPKKAKLITAGYEYNVDMQFTAAKVAPAVIELENNTDPPCRHYGGNYKIDTCLMKCQQDYIKSVCDCNPTFLMPYNGEYYFDFLVN